MIKSAIITGATGAIGTALIEELINRNIEVMVFVRSNSKRINNVPSNNLISIKYYALDEIKNVVNDSNKKYDVFFHLAWSGTSGNGRNDKLLQQKNVEYALDAVDCAKRFGCRKFVGVGSQAEYGRVNVALNDQTPTNPENEYGKAKLEASERTKEKCNLLGIEFNWIRVLSVYGINDGENSLISYAINKMLNNEDLNVTKCEQMWDYLNSKDAASAIYTVAEKGINIKTYVLGSGKTRLLKEYLKEIKEVLKSNSIINFGSVPYSNNQVMYLCADISDLKKIGWEPKVSFVDGIISIVDNYEHNK